MRQGYDEEEGYPLDFTLLSGASESVEGGGSSADQTAVLNVVLDVGEGGGLTPDKFACG